MQFYPERIAFMCTSLKLVRQEDHRDRDHKEQTSDVGQSPKFLLCDFLRQFMREE